MIGLKSLPYFVVPSLLNIVFFIETYDQLANPARALGAW